MLTASNLPSDLSAMIRRWSLILVLFSLASEWCASVSQHGSMISVPSILPANTPPGVNQNSLAAHPPIARLYLCSPHTVCSSCSAVIAFLWAVQDAKKMKVGDDPRYSKQQGRGSLHSGVD